MADWADLGLGGSRSDSDGWGVGLGGGNGWIALWALEGLKMGIFLGGWRNGVEGSKTGIFWRG
jgi:hypothetical protein